MSRTVSSIACRRPFLVLIVLFTTVLLLAQAALAQSSVPSRITDPVDNSRTVTLRGNTHPLARPQFDLGMAPAGMPANRMLMLLSRSSEQQSALETLLQEQQTPGSPNFHRWLTPDDFTSRFGPSQSDLQQVTGWLTSQGFTVSHVGAGNTVIEFSGTAAMVRSAFRTEIHKYGVNGEEHWANASDPRIPAALAPVVSGIVSLNNFSRKPQSHRKGQYQRNSDGSVTPAFTVTGGGTTYYAVAPGDWATIYNTNPLLQSGINGTGQTIAILGVTNVNLTDVYSFRTLFGLGQGNTSVVIDGPDPGIQQGDETEALLDLEWSNAVAPGATIYLVTAQNTETTSGLDLAALHVIDNNLAGVMSMSYGACEAALGNAENQFVQSIDQQAASQGITVLVSSGDSGSDGCDDPNSLYVAQSGLGINGLASTPNNIAVGGTDFNDSGSQAQYWSSSNAATSLSSALSYIPETTWNETCAAGATSSNLNVCPVLPSSGTPPASLSLWSGSGGPSTCSTSTISGSTVTCTSGTPKPAWQTGAGVPNDGVRDIPDVSFFSAGDSNSRSFYVVCEADAVSGPSCQLSSSGVYFIGVGGTSAATPSFAGVVALAAQKSGTRLGNLNYQLYPIAAGSGNSCASNASSASCVFHDVTTGNISVPCKAGSPHCSVTSGSATGVLVTSGNTPAYTAAAGYDLATGLGSVNATNLVNAIAARVNGFTPTTTSLTLNGGTAAVTANHGDAISIGVNVSPASSGSVALLGSSGGIDSNPLVAGSATWNSRLFPGGSYSVKAHFPGDGAHGASDSASIPVTINPEASQTFVNVVSFDANTGNLISNNASSVVYGSPYLLRIDVGDAAASYSSTTGISSKCSTGAASCPTGLVNVYCGSFFQGAFRLNSSGYTEDQGFYLAPGTCNISANYLGDASYGTSNGADSVTVTKAPTTILASANSTSSLTYGNHVYLNVTVNTQSNGGTPFVTNSTLLLTDNGVATPAKVSSVSYVSGYYAASSVQLDYVPLAAGSHTLQVQFLGDSNYLASNTASLSLNISQASLSPQCALSPTIATTSIPVNMSCQFGANLGAEPTGTITFKDNGTPISGTVTYSGQAGTGNSAAYLTGSMSYVFTQTGSHTITATYSGDANYLSSTGSSASNPVTVTSQIGATTYAPYAQFNPTPTNYAITLTAYVQAPDAALPTPTGTFTLYDNGQPINGSVTYSSSSISHTLSGAITYTPTSTGTHSITSTYSGDSIYQSANSPVLSLAVTDKLVTRLFTQFSAAFPFATRVGQDVQLQASVANVNYTPGPAITGTISFSDNGTVIAAAVPVDGNGAATFTVNYATPGVHNIAATYSGDNYHLGSTVAWIVQAMGPVAVVLPNYTFTSKGSGGQGSYLEVFNNTSTAANVIVSCKSDTPTATCSIDQTVFNLGAGGAGNSNFQMAWPGLTGDLHRERRPFSSMPLVFAGLLAGLAYSSRRKRLIALTMLLAALIVSMTSCGGGGNNNYQGGGVTIPSSRTIVYTFTATDGTHTDTETYTVTVK